MNMKLALAATIILLSSNQTSNANDIYINQVGHDTDIDIVQDGADNKVRSLSTTSGCLLYTSPSPRDGLLSRMPSSA